MSVHYLSENNDRDDIALGIMPALWDILGALRTPTTWVNNVKGCGHFSKK